MLLGDDVMLRQHIIFECPDSSVLTSPALFVRGNMSYRESTQAVLSLFSGMFVFIHQLIGAAR